MPSDKTNKRPDETAPSFGSLPELVDYSLVEQLFDLMEDGVVVHDENRQIYLVNRATEQITGLSRDEIVGMDCHEAFPPDGMCGAHCAFKKGASPKSERRHHQVTFRRADGEDRRIRVSSDSVMIGGKERGVLAVIRDITELSNLRWRLERTQSFHGMIGVSTAVREVFETIRSVASSEYPVLIIGESGTGKELAASAIHNESRKKGGPFVPVNCGALPENILESELFGHVRGAFTGAIKDKKGRFELADGGTLFLDEVGELPLSFQVKLLRVLQEKRFERVGGEKSITADFRIVSATNRDLRELVQKGEFREDLFYRLCVVPIELPPLRSRHEDIPILVEHILEQVQQEIGKEIAAVSDEAMELLINYPWPGNIRELINALQFASVRCLDEAIQVRHLPYEIRHGSSVESLTWAKTRGDSNYPLPVAGGWPSEQPKDAIPQKRTRNKLTREAVERALARAGGNKVQAAKLLGVGRATLYRFFNENRE